VKTSLNFLIRSLEFSLSCLPSTIYFTESASAGFPADLVIPSSLLSSRNFLKNFANTVADATNAEVAFDRIDVWWQDEARVGQQGTITRMWAKKGTRPRAIRQQQFEYAYIYGAVCPQKDEAVALVMPVANSEAMTLHLKEISKATAPGRHAIVIMDRAGWHTSNSLGQFDNLTPVMLPPYSPELNPVEQVWQCLRDRDLANRTYEGYEDIVDSCCKAWNKFTRTLGAVRSLCSRDWAIL